MTRGCDPDCVDDVEHVHSPVTAPAMISRSTVVAKLPADRAKSQAQHIAAHTRARDRARGCAARGVPRSCARRESRPALRGIAPRRHLRARAPRPAPATRPRPAAAPWDGCRARRSAARVPHRGVDREHAAAAIEIGDIARQQPIPAALRHALGQDGVEDDAARRRQHEAGVVPAAPPSIAPAACRPAVARRAAPARDCRPRGRSAAGRNS